MTTTALDREIARLKKLDAMKNAQDSPRAKNERAAWSKAHLEYHRKKMSARRARAKSGKAKKLTMTPERARVLAQKRIDEAEYDHAARIALTKCEILEYIAQLEKAIEQKDIDACQLPAYVLAQSFRNVDASLFTFYSGLLRDGTNYTQNAVAKQKEKTMKAQKRTPSQAGKLDARSVRIDKNVTAENIADAMSVVNPNADSTTSVSLVGQTLNIAIELGANIAFYNPKSKKANPIAATSMGVGENSPYISLGDGLALSYVVFAPMAEVNRRTSENASIAAIQSAKRDAEKAASELQDAKQKAKDAMAKLAALIA